MRFMPGDLLVQKSFHPIYNTVKHQTMNSECGMFCVYFIIEMLKGRTFQQITDNIIGDVAVNQKRNEYFRQPSGDNPLDIMEMIKDSGLLDDLDD